MTSTREQILADIVKFCLQDSLISKSLMYIALIGSTRTKEEVEGYSDLDILLILNANESGTIDKDVLLKLKEISCDFSRQCDIEISLLPHTIFDFEQYVDFNYLIHYSWGEVLYGNKDDFKKVFKDLIDKKYSEKTRKDLVYYNLVHARFNLIRKYVSWNKFNKSNYTKDILKLEIDLIIEMCDWALVYKNIFEETKLNILQNFSKFYTLQKYGDIPKQAYDIRLKWNSSSFEEANMSKFIDESILFVQELVDIIYKEHVTKH